MPNFGNIGLPDFSAHAKDLQNAYRDWTFERGVHLTLAADRDRIPLAVDPTDTQPPYDSFSTAVKAGHAAIEAEVTALVQDGSLGSHEAVPPLGALGDDILDLGSAYQAMEEAALNPEVVIWPRHFSPYVWSQMLSGKPVPYKLVQTDSHIFLNKAYRVPAQEGQPAAQQTGGLIYPNHMYGRCLPGFDEWTRQDNEERLPLGEPAAPVDLEIATWGVAVVSGRNGVAHDLVSPNAYHGSDSIKKLRHVLGVDALLTDEQALSLMSPTANAYQQLQWQRLQAGRLPVDIVSASLLQDRTHRKTCLAGWGVQEASILFGALDPGAHTDSYGIRPTVHAADLKYFTR